MKVTKLVYAAMCLALALVLPFLTGQIPQIGSALCPMHLPVHGREKGSRTPKSEGSGGIRPDSADAETGVSGSIPDQCDL